MPHADLYIATKHCQAMRDLIVHHTGGWADAESLDKFQQMTAAAALAVHDLECKPDVLRLRILREITAFQGRLTYIEAVRTGAEQDGHRRDTHSPKAR